MGVIRIESYGSFNPPITKEFKAITSGHAVAVEDAIAYLRDSALPAAVAQDKELRADGHAPDDNFAEYDKRHQEAETESATGERSMASRVRTEAAERNFAAKNKHLLDILKDIPLLGDWHGEGLMQRENRYMTCAYCLAVVISNGDGPRVEKHEDHCVYARAQKELK